MNIVYLIGNGFDLKLGLRTSYRDFYNTYLKTRSEQGSVAALKDKISGDLKTWSDMELAFGQYAQHLHDASELREIYFDLVVSLQKYLQQEEDEFDCSKLDSNQLFNDLKYPERFLTESEKVQLDDVFQGRTNQSIRISVLTLNYTQTFERIIDKKIQNLSIGKRENHNVVLHAVEHIHGRLDGTLVLGVNDTSQINNDRFHDDINVSEVLVKPQNNKTQGHLKDSQCQSLISQANLIVVFGSSLGATDKMWWEAIAQRLSGACQLILFDRGATLEQQLAIFHAQYKREIKERFLRAAGYTNSDNALDSFIYVAITDEYFTLTKDA